jgi:hypothetical protein
LDCDSPYRPPRCSAYEGYDTGHDTGARALPGFTTTWSVEGARFEDGATLSGYFVVDSGQEQPVAWSLCATAAPDGSAPFTALHYTRASATTSFRDGTYFFSSHELFGPYSNSYRSLRLRDGAGFLEADGIGETRDLLESLECVNCAPSRYLVEGVVVSVAPDDVTAPEDCM